MTYACAAIIYGVNFQTVLPEPNWRDANYAEQTANRTLLLNLLENAGLVQTMYNGNGDSPYWIGPTLFKVEEHDSEVDIRFPEPADKENFKNDWTKLVEFLETRPEPAAKSLHEKIRVATPTIFLAWGIS